MPNFKLSLNAALAWFGIFVCLVIVQTIFTQPAPEVTKVSDSQKTLIQNAVVPIFLSEDKTTAKGQLQNLIQDTDIRQVRVYSSDQQLITEAINGSAPGNSQQTLVDTFPIVFQGSMAGSVQLDIASNPIEENSNFIFLAIGISILITFCAWLAFTIYQFVYTYFAPTLAAKKVLPGVLEAEKNTPPQSVGSSILLYIYPFSDEKLKADTQIQQECMASFYRRLEDHLRIYGGRILSLSNDKIICRMPSNQSSNDYQQALIFSWGIARPWIYRDANQQYQLEIKTLLHKTRSAAKSGHLYRAIMEIDTNTEEAIIGSEHYAHLSEQMINSFGSTDFEYLVNPNQNNLYSIRNIKKSLETLWNKQESMVTELHQQ